MPNKDECYGCRHYGIDSPRCLECNYDLWEGAEAPTTPPVSQSNSSDLLKRKASLNDEFRLILSHRLMGHDLDMERSEFDELLDDLVEKAIAF